MKFLLFFNSLFLKLTVFLKGIVFAFDTLVTKKKDETCRRPRKQVIILGNGPSLNDVDFSKIERKRYSVVCVNDFPFQHDLFWTLKPDYLCLLDPVYFDKSPFYQDIRKRLLQALRKVDWPLTVITTQSKRLPIENACLSYAWIAKNEFGGDDCLELRHFLYSRNLVHFGLQNVVIGAAFYFVTKRVDTIYLAGIDMSEFKGLSVDENNEVWVESPHSYGMERSSMIESGVVSRGEFYKLLSYYTLMFTQFHYLSLYAKRQHVKIYNLSENSFVDVFEKKYLFLKGKGEKNR